MKAGGDIFNDLFDEFTLWAILVGIFTFSWLFHHSLKYRSKDGSDNNIDNLTPGVFPVENDDLKLEVTWTVVPFILIVYLTFISWGPLDEIWTEDEDAHIVTITASQWSWSFDCSEVNNTDICDSSQTMDVEGRSNVILSLKAGESYTFILYSEDVTHSPFFVDWGIKEDALPGQETRMYYTPSTDEIGTNLLYCAEYCGDDHGYMTAIIEVHA
ncbi:MAG: cytochrome c oxidase subunit II [Candidatus Thalassarchaeaceae archaeon]|nr:cytochrome c oxidase subunit II [Candidatus Thalassarchaeaceae archaeon]